MRNALRYGLFSSFVVVGCVVAGVEIDPSLGDGGEVESGAGGDAGETGQGGSTGGKGGAGGSATGGKGGTGGSSQGGTGKGGTDSGGTDSGGSAGKGGSPTGGGPTGGGPTGGGPTGGGPTGGGPTGGAGSGGTAGSGPPVGGAGTGGAGTGGTAGSGPPTGGAGGASCVGIKSNAACTQEGLSCPSLPCGLADVGRRSCNCATVWTCTACNFAGTRFEVQPAGIVACPIGIADEVACSNTSAVCGPQAGEYCACYTSPSDGMIWDCDAPPSPWACTGSSLTLMHTSAVTHDHLPVSAAESLNMITQVRAATAGTSLTLPQDADHTHALPLTQARVATLLSGGFLTGVVSSTSNQHTHTYSVQCGP